MAASKIRDPLTGGEAEFLFTAQDNRGIPGQFDYYRGDAGHVFIGEAPANLGDHYAGGYQTIPTNEAELAEAAKGDAYRLELVQKLVPAGKFLEIGPWIGLVAYSALKAGYDVHALEMSQDCVDLLSGVGVDAVQTADPAATLAASGETYDVIGLWHSIEHIPRPWAVIEAAARALNPNGVLVIAAPNPESAQLAVLGKHWLHLDAPRHLHLIAASSYIDIGERGGLTVVEVTSDDRLGRILDRNGWEFEAIRRVKGLPVLRTLARLLLRDRLARRHRRPDTLDGAGFTITMQRMREGGLPPKKGREW